MKLPKIVCKEMEEEKCISLPYTKEEVVELERCTAILGPEKCEDAEIIVPKQVFVSRGFYILKIFYWCVLLMFPTELTPWKNR